MSMTESLEMEDQKNLTKLLDTVIRVKLFLVKFSLGGEGRGGEGGVNTLLTNLRTTASTAGLVSGIYHRYRSSRDTSTSTVAVHIAHQGDR